MMLLWLVLTGGELQKLWFGLPAAAISAGISTRLMKEWRLRSLKGLVFFVPFFIRQSLEGGFDVAMRALHPRMPLEPALINYPVRLPEGAASVFLAGVISLLPGTLTTQLSDGHLRIHVLDIGLPVVQKLRILEEKVGGIFGIKLPYENFKGG